MLKYSSKNNYMRNYRVQSLPNTRLMSSSEVKTYRKKEVQKRL